MIDGVQERRDRPRRGEREDQLARRPPRRPCEQDREREVEVADVADQVLVVRRQHLHPRAAEREVVVEATIGASVACNARDRGRERQAGERHPQQAGHGSRSFSGSTVDARQVRAMACVNHWSKVTLPRLASGFVSAPERSARVTGRRTSSAREPVRRRQLPGQLARAQHLRARELRDRQRRLGLGRLGQHAADLARIDRLHRELQAGHDAEPRARRERLRHERVELRRAHDRPGDARAPGSAPPARPWPCSSATPTRSTPTIETPT